MVPNEVRLLVSGQVHSQGGSEGKAAFSDEWFVPGVWSDSHYRGHLLQILYTEYLSGTIREAGILMYIYSVESLPVSISVADSVRKGWELNMLKINGLVFLFDIA